MPFPPEGAPATQSAGFPPVPPRPTERARGPFYPIFRSNPPQRGGGAEKAVRATPPEDTTVEFVPVQVQQKWATLFSHIALALKDALDSPGPGQTRYIGNKCTLTLYPRN